MNTIPLPPRPGETMPVPRPASDADALLLMIERVARDPSIDIERLERLLAMRDRLRNEERRAAYDDALAKVQAELQPIIKRGEIKIREGSKGQPYALLEDVITTIKPILGRHGFSIQFRIQQADTDKISVTTIVAHAQGHREETTISLPADKTGSKNATQAIGSSVSYGRRYGIMSMFNLATQGEDNDAAHGTGEVISTEQEAELQALIEETGSDLTLFCRFMKAESLADIPASKFEFALTQLRRKLNKESRQGAASPGEAGQGRASQGEAGHGTAD